MPQYFWKSVPKSWKFAEEWWHFFQLLVFTTGSFQTKLRATGFFYVLIFVLCSSSTLSKVEESADLPIVWNSRYRFKWGSREGTASQNKDAMFCFLGCRDFPQTTQWRWIYLCMIYDWFQDILLKLEDLTADQWSTQNLPVNQRLVFQGQDMPLRRRCFGPKSLILVGEKIYPNMVVPLVTGKQLGSTVLLSFFRIPDIIVLHDLFTWQPFKFRRIGRLLQPIWINISMNRRNKQTQWFQCN